MHIFNVVCGVYTSQADLAGEAEMSIEDRCCLGFQRPRIMKKHSPNPVIDCIKHGYK